MTLCGPTLVYLGRPPHTQPSPSCQAQQWRTLVKEELVLRKMFWDEKLTQPGLGSLWLPGRVSLLEGRSLFADLAVSPKITFFLMTNFLFKTDLTHNVHWSVSYGLWHGTNSKTKGRQNSSIGFIPPIERLRTWLQTKADTNVEFWIRGFKQNTELTPFLLTQPVSSLSMPSE